MAGVVALAVVLVACLAGVGFLVLRDKGPDGAYQAVDDLCGLPEVAALGPARVGPHGQRDTTNGQPSVRCSVTVTSGKFGSAIVNVAATIKESAEEAKRFYEGWLDMYADGETITDIPGLGTKTSWYDGDGIELIGYDDNLVLKIGWNQGGGDPPADLISRLAKLGNAVLDACRRPGVTPPPRATSFIPALPSPSGPTLPYRVVDDLCEVTKLDRIGKVATKTADVRESGSFHTMNCTARLQSETPGHIHQVIVVAIVDKKFTDRAPVFAGERANARDARIVPGLGTEAFFQPDYIGGPRLLTYQANLYLSVSYTSTGAGKQPKDLANRMADVALSAMDGLKS